MALPPVFAASALYDSLLQAALRQFFSRATFETEPIPSLSSDGRLAIEPTSDPSVLAVRWFGSRHVLHVPARRPFTPHEVRLARAIGAVLAARYRAIFDPKQMLERGRAVSRRDRGSLRRARFSTRAASSDRCSSSRRADLIATAIEVLRVAALSSYENHAISSGVLCSTDDDRIRRRRVRRTAGVSLFAGADRRSRASTGCATASRRCSSSTASGVVLDIVEIARYARRRRALEVPARRRYRAARAGDRRQPATSASCSARRTRSRCSPKACRCSASATRAGTCSI